MALKFNLMFPMRAVKHYREWIGDGSLGEVAKYCEEVGFDGFSMSEHPIRTVSGSRTGATTRSIRLCRWRSLPRRRKTSD